MGRYKKLAENSLVFLIANFSSKFITLLLVRLYTGVLTTAEYGIIDILYTTSNLVIPIITLSAAEAVLRFSIDDVKNRSRIFSTGVTLLICGFVVSLVMIPILSQIDIFKNNILLFYLLSFSNATYIITSCFIKGIGKTKIFAIGGLLLTLVHVLLNILFLVVFQWGVTGYFLASIISNFAVAFLLFVIAKLYQYITLRLQKSYTIQMLKYSLPLIPNSISWWLMESFNRYALTFMISESATGLYAVANKIPAIISTISGVFSQAWQLSSVDEAESKDKDSFFTEIFQLMAVVLFISTSLLMVILQPLYRILVAPGFYEGWETAPFLLCATIFTCFSNFLGSNYVAMKKTGGVFLTTVIGAVVNIALNLALVPILGIKGSAMATAISFMITWVIRVIDTRKFVRIKLTPMGFFVPLGIVILQAVLLTTGVTSLLIQSLCSISLLLVCGKDLISIVKKMRILFKKLRKK